MARAPKFWWRPRPGFRANALWPVAKIWGVVAEWRMTQPPRLRPSVPVICIGNFVVGGAGKTPTAIAVARAARGRGFKPGFLTRGYGGTTTGPLLVDLKAHGPDKVGDEAMLLGAVAPTVVARDRAVGAQRLIEAGVNLIVMDDGFQNPGLGKDLALIAVDAGSGMGNGMTLPAGPLRAPLKLQLRRADALIVIGSGEAAEPLIRAAARGGRAVFRAHLEPTRVRDWRKQPILAFAGIGRPQKFFDTLAEIKAPVAQIRSFPDHHVYSESDAERLIAEAEAGGLRLVTTEKDMARLAGAEGALKTLRERAEALAVQLEFENVAALNELVEEAVRKAAARQAR